MKQQLPNGAPDARTLVKFVASIAWRSRWLIALASALTVVLTYFLYNPDTVSAWTGKTIVKIGIAPPAEFVLQESGPALAPIESPRSLVARISDPIFKTKVIDRTAFEQAQASLSKSLASSSMRGVALESERDVAIEVSAASRADVEAVFRALMAEIDSVHASMVQQRLDTLRARIEDAKSRVALIEKSSGDLRERLLGGASDDKDSQRSVVLLPGPAPSTEPWNRLKDRIERSTNLIKFSEKTVVYTEPETYPIAQRAIGLVKASILAGLAMLAFMIVLTILTSPARPPAG
jgi:hypothetical protein